MTDADKPQQWVTTGQWVSTGVTVSVRVDSADRVPPFDPETGEHLWTWIAAFRAGTAEAPMLDAENLLMVQGQTCFHCQLPHSPRVARQLCQGQSRGA